MFGVHFLIFSEKLYLGLGAPSENYLGARNLFVESQANCVLYYIQMLLAAVRAYKQSKQLHRVSI